MQEGSEITFAQEFNAWFRKEKTSKSALASKIGSDPVSVRSWLAGRAFPRDTYCDKLYALTTLDCFSPTNRAKARAAHERLIPPRVKKERRSKYLASPELFRTRSLASWRKRHAKSKQSVTEQELGTLRTDPRLRKNVCRECGEILCDVGPHLWPKHGLAVADYKIKWGFLRTGNATRSEDTNLKQSNTMKRIGHRPPKWTHLRLPDALRASIRTNKKGAARLEERLNSRGKSLGGRPLRWKRASGGGLVTDARIAELRLGGKSVPEIAAAAELTLTPVFYRLKRMGYPKRFRAFLHGEPVGWKHITTLCSDFNLTSVRAAELLDISEDWIRRKLTPKRKTEALSPTLARRLLRVRAELLAEFRKRPASRQGGRPKQLTPSDKGEVPLKYHALLRELRALRAWVQEQDRAPSTDGIWNWLCERFRSRTFRTLQFWPQFFRWSSKEFDTQSFRRGQWVPRDLAVQFLADDYGASQDTVAGVVSHAPKEMHYNGATIPHATNA